MTKAIEKKYSQERRRGLMIRRNELIIKMDKFIGYKVYELRLYNGLSRQKLARAIGVSGVQLRKYEQGLNSINANRRIMLIALALGQKVSYFFEGIEEAKSKAVTLTKHQRMCIEVSKKFRQIRSPKHRGAVIALIKTLVTP